MPKRYKGKTKAEVRAIVLANNKNKDASDKSRMRMNTEIKLWSLQNRDLSSKKTSNKPKPSTKKTTVKKDKNETYHGAAGKIMNEDGTVNKTASRENTAHLGKEGFSNYGSTVVNKKLSRDETYSDYAKSINREAPEEGLYKKNSATPKRGFIMKRNRK